MYKLTSERILTGVPVAQLVQSHSPGKGAGPNVYRSPVRFRSGAQFAPNKQLNNIEKKKRKKKEKKKKIKED